MVVFPILMAACGAIASLHLSWIFVSLVGVVIMPVYVGAMVWSGMSFLTASSHAAIGLGVLQASYALSGWAREAVRSRRARTQREDVPLEASIDAPSPARLDWPLFGGWLPLLAFYEPRCRADGSPWNGIDDPGYRTTVLAVGWFGRAFSVAIGSPKRVTPRARRTAPPQERAMSEMDRRIAKERRKIEPGTDRTH